MNWDDPAERFELIDRVGHEEYNRLIQKHFKDSTVAVVNGYPIRPVQSVRFGRIFMVHGADVGFVTQEKAEAHAKTLPPGKGQQ